MDPVAVTAADLCQSDARLGPQVRSFFPNWHTLQKRALLPGWCHLSLRSSTSGHRFPIPIGKEFR